MNATIPRPRRDIRTSVDELIGMHGFLRVMLALTWTPFRHFRTRPPPARRTDPRDLSDHIRRDIGLEPADHRHEPAAQHRFWL